MHEVLNRRAPAAEDCTGRLSCQLRAKIHTGSLKLNNRMETWFLLWRSDSRVNTWCSVPACMYCSDCWWWRCLHHNRPFSLSVSSLLSGARCFLLYAQSLCVWYWAACFLCTGSLDTLCLQLFLSVVLAAECVCNSFHVGLVHTVQK